jgi:5-methylcytosine-specific restriction endonuclease McrA
MSDLPDDLVATMMVKCARRCCICRRFRPTKLQVHHIIERNQDGDNDEENLIVICLSCHSDVHTTVPFTRRFTVEELKGHRDAVIRAGRRKNWTYGTKG